MFVGRLYKAALSACTVQLCALATCWFVWRCFSVTNAIMQRDILHENRPQDLTSDLAVKRANHHGSRNVRTIFELPGNATDVFPTVGMHSIAERRQQYMGPPALCACTLCMTSV